MAACALQSAEPRCPTVGCSRCGRTGTRARETVITRGQPLRLYYCGGAITPGRWPTTGNTWPAARASRRTGRGRNCDGRTRNVSAKQDRPPRQAPKARPGSYAGHNGPIASASVMRVVCLATGMRGTGFLHKSGRVITAAHVVTGSLPQRMRLVPTNSAEIEVTSLVTDAIQDLALLTPSQPIERDALPITRRRAFEIGAPISIWGYPGGYQGTDPLLTFGDLAGLTMLSLVAPLSDVGSSTLQSIAEILAARSSMSWTDPF